MSTSVRVATWLSDTGQLEATQHQINLFLEMKVLEVISFTQSQSTKPHSTTTVVFTLLYRPNPPKRDRPDPL